MAVTSRVTTLEDFETGPVFVGYGGGQGAGINTDIVIEGSQSGSRRSDGQTSHGFGVQFTATNLSNTDEHMLAWYQVIQWPQVTQLRIRISSGADDDHTVPTNQFPSLGGWIPVWIHINRTPEAGGSANAASISEVGALLNIGNVGGNAQNNILDKIGHSTQGLAWSGSGGNLNSFVTHESTAKDGVLIFDKGINFCYARLELSTTASTTFTDSGFNITFPDQTLVSNTFMGITCDLSNAGTSITLSNATIQSADPIGATRRPDLIVTGTNGSLASNSVNWLGLRTMDVTSACTFDGGIIDTIAITQNSSEFVNATIRTRSASGVATIVNPTTGAGTGFNKCIFENAGGHAFEYTTPQTVSFDNLRFNGYGADGTATAAIRNTSGGLLTINVINGGDTPTVIDVGAGSTTTVNNAVTLKVTATDRVTGLPIENARVRLKRTSDSVVIMTGLTDSNGEIINSSYNFNGEEAVEGWVRKSSAPGPYYQEALLSGTIFSTGYSQPVSLSLDGN